MASSNYLTIVNNSIMEAGTDLAFFASNGSDFATPPTVQHARFKKWVRDAWRDIQQTAPDWHFSTEQFSTRLHPRIMWTGANAINVSTSIPLGNYDITPTNTGDVMQTVEVVDGKILANGPLDGVDANSATGYVDLAGDEDDILDFPLNVGSTQLTYLDPPDAVSLIITGWGSYLFDEDTQEANTTLLDGVKQINPTTFRASEFGGESVVDAQAAREQAVHYIPWESFLELGYDIGANNPGFPRYVTQDYEGRYRFYPPLNKDYLIVFNYEKGVQFLSAYTDVPEGIPEEFVDLIMWRALQYYGMYDEQPSISNTQLTGRADKQAKIMQQRLERQTREPFHFKPARLW